MTLCKTMSDVRAGWILALMVWYVNMLKTTMES